MGQIRSHAEHEHHRLGFHLDRIGFRRSIISARIKDATAEFHCKRVLALVRHRVLKTKDAGTPEDRLVAAKPADDVQASCQANDMLGEQFARKFMRLWRSKEIHDQA
jgi:hypothetical protein